MREWASALCWLSPAWFVGRREREPVGRDGERYAWTRILVIEVRDGRLASMCDVDVEDEEAAFAYAEERVRAASSRLAVSNRASDVAHPIVEALRARNIDAVVGVYSDQLVYDDIGGSVATRSRAGPVYGPPLSASAGSTANSRRAH